MRRVVFALLVGVAAIGAPAFAQPADVNKILADARAALGGEKRLAAVKTLAATGQSTRVVNEQSTAPTDAELAIELPDRFMKKDVLAMLGSTAITRASGFSGDAVINVIDQPPMPSGGAVVVFRAGPGGGAAGEVVTSEQKEAAQKAQLLVNKQEFARLALGLFAASPAAYPLQFAYGGQAESPDGKADIVDVTGEGGFACRLFVDTVTHLPLMLSWMAREPLILTQTVGGAPGARVGATPAAGGANVLSVQAQGKPLTPEERAKLMAELEEQRKKAEAERRVVEYRLYYGDYREVDGVKVPFRLQRSIDGKPTEELALDNVKINGRIDARKFDVR